MNYHLGIFITFFNKFVYFKHKYFNAENTNWSVWIPYGEWLWWITFKCKHFWQIIIYVFIISHFYRFVNSYIAPCIPLCVLNNKKITLECFTSEKGDRRKPKLPFIWSIKYWTQYVFFSMSFSSIITELLLSLYIINTWLNKEVNSFSSVAVNIKSIQGFIMFHLDDNDLSRFIFRWKWSKDMKVSYIPIESSMKFVMSSSENSA